MSKDAKAKIVKFKNRGADMTFFNWDEKLATNIEEFDTHHKHLISLFNDVYEKVFKCEDLDEERELTQQTLHNLTEYIRYHFSAEEALMIKFDYPGYLEHKKEHDYYIKEVHKLETEHQQGGVALSFTAFVLLKDWIAKHILGTDKEYEEFFESKGVK